MEPLPVTIRRPKDAFPYHARSFAPKEKGDLDDAIADYDQGIKLDPKPAAIARDVI
jgi:hypothetical protein